MPIIFSTLIGFLADYFGRFFADFGRRSAILIAFFAGVVIAVSLYFTTMHTLIDGIRVTIPENVSMVWGWVIPANAVSLITAFYTAKITMYAHFKFLEHLKLTAKTHSQ